jgi:UDP-N-acetylmuramate dehydrogenase
VTLPFERGRSLSELIERGRSLSELTTLGLGGPAREFVRVEDRETLVEALRWAEASGAPVGILGGGSNLVVADAGFPGLVLHMATRGIEISRTGNEALLTVQAGEVWDDVVALSLNENLAGLECLTGIPGSAGATPIQNVGAYGQEVSDTLEAVEVLARDTLSTRWLSAGECDFGYRMSRFKREPERFVVLAARFRLRWKGAPLLRYPELVQAVNARASTPSVQEVANVVRDLRAKKSMLLRPDDENRQSAGSFFMNPVLTHERAECVKQEALAHGIVTRVQEVPSFAAGEGLTKLAAGWLIERAGIAKGMRRGAVGVSTKHALALVHHGGGSTRELLALADEVRERVRSVFGVELELEPVRWGFTSPTPP